MPEEAPGKILVVDDDRATCQFVSDILKSKGYRTVTASNGKEALDVVRQNMLSGVITDLTMPEMGGMDFLRHLNRLLPDVPVVVMTGKEKIKNAEEAVRQGARNYILKPFSANSVLETLKAAKSKASSIRCSFCGCHQDEVKRLVAGQKRGVFICDRCIELCSELIKEAGTAEETAASESHLMVDFDRLRENVRRSADAVMNNRLTASHLLTDVYTLLEFLGKMRPALLNAQTNGVQEE